MPLPNNTLLRATLWLAKADLAASDPAYELVAVLFGKTVGEVAARVAKVREVLG
jgi:hypothetical protein